MLQDSVGLKAKLYVGMALEEEVCNPKIPGQAIYILFTWLSLTDFKQGLK